MKTRFSTYDIVCSVAQLQKLVGLRVNQIYDIDNKTYLIRFADKDAKTVLLLESGNRFHTTAFEWPKNMAPSGFTMKLRKHLKNKRLERFVQLELDRIVDLQFGMGDAAYHIILELYDRGNIILTDHERTILNILRPHVEGEEIRFAVREKYPESRAKAQSGAANVEQMRDWLVHGKPGDSLKKVLNPVLDYGPAVIDHILKTYNLSDVVLASDETPAIVEPPAEVTNKKGKAIVKPQKAKKPDPNRRVFDFTVDLPVLLQALSEADRLMNEAKSGTSKGYIIQKRELRSTASSDATDAPEYFDHNIEYHPFLFAQHAAEPHKEFETFDAAVDEFYSTSESQKIDVKTMHQEREALKKLSNVKRDHSKRLEELGKWQVYDKHKAELITRNQTLVDNAILAIRSAIANQLPWPEIQNLVKAAQTNGDQVAGSIRQLKLEKNHITLYLTDPYNVLADEEDDEDAEAADEKLPPMTIEIDLGLSAFANATKYYDNKRTAAKKQQRTVESSTKAMKSAERKTQQSLKEMRTISTITKARKVYWFEKFYWFISSENYLIIGGRDQQQNELIVKRYMRATDIYVHAEIQGASSVVIRNPSGKEIPPKTLLEAGTMAISYSVAWDAKVVTNAYWVRSNQVSKTAPTGEYLGTGSFMIRGKKNFLPPCHLILGMSFLFKLEESSVERHAGERKVRTFEDDDDVSDISNNINAVQIENEQLDQLLEDPEIQLLDSDDEPDADANDEKNNKNPDHAQDVAATLDSDDEDDPNGFPNTHIKIEHETGKVSVSGDRVLLQQLHSVDESAVFLGDTQPVVIHTGAQAKIKQQKKDRDARKGKKVQVVDSSAQSTEEDAKANGPKRGQKGKLKKIREKYKDQDEEEKAFRMDILKSAGTHKKAAAAAAAAAKVAKVTFVKVENSEKSAAEKAKYSKDRPEDGNVGGGGVEEEADEPDEVGVGADVEMLDTLTGCPVDEDEILFAVPVIAPYQALTNYKYKVKITPGTGRRGKASKTALQIFMRDKTCSTREKDLLKGVKDEVVARNMPGKVKLSAPQLHKFKK